MPFLIFKGKISSITGFQWLARDFFSNFLVLFTRDTYYSNSTFSLCSTERNNSIKICFHFFILRERSSLYIINHCCKKESKLFTNQYNMSPAGKFINNKTKITGISIMILACMGSAGGGLRRCCKNIEMPIKIGKI